MSVTMVEGDYMVAVGFYKLIEGVAHIAIINVHDAGIWISDSHWRHIHFNGNISLMIIAVAWFIHFVAGSHKQVVTAMGHSCRACIEWNCSVSSIQTAGLYFVPILIILRDTENLEGVVLFRIFLTTKDIIIIAGVIESTKDRQFIVDKLSAERFKIRAVIFHKELALDSAWLDTHIIAVVAHCQVRFHCVRPLHIVLSIHIRAWIRNTLRHGKGTERSSRHSSRNSHCARQDNAQHSFLHIHQFHHLIQKLLNENTFIYIISQRKAYVNENKLQWEWFQ